MTDMPAPTAITTQRTGPRRKVCDLPGFEDCWIDFAHQGYPRKLRREWAAAETAEAIWSVVARYVVAWNLRDVAGQVVELPADIAARPLELTDGLEESLFGWVLRTFATNWLSGEYANA